MAKRKSKNEPVSDAIRTAEPLALELVASEDLMAELDRRTDVIVVFHSKLTDCPCGCGRRKMVDAIIHMKGPCKDDVREGLAMIVDAFKNV